MRIKIVHLPPKRYDMAKYTFSEFAALTGVQAKHLTTYAQRGKIVILSDHTIESTNLVNAEFIRQRAAKASTQPKQAAQISVPAQTDAPHELQVSASVKSINDLKADKLKAEIESIKTKNARIAGRLIETDKVTTISREAILAYQNGTLAAAESVIRNFGASLNATNAQMTEAVHDLKLLINAETERNMHNLRSSLQMLM